MFGFVAVGYPMLRNLQLVPLEWILEQANAYNPARGASLAYRFYNEGALLERAADKELFGWGGYGRNLVRHPETGEILSIPDGQWIVTFDGGAAVSGLAVDALANGAAAFPCAFVSDAGHKPDGFTVECDGNTADMADRWRHPRVCRTGGRTERQGGGSVQGAVHPGWFVKSPAGQAYGSVAKRGKYVSSTHC